MTQGLCLILATYTIHGYLISDRLTTYVSDTKEFFREYIRTVLRYEHVLGGCNYTRELVQPPKNKDVSINLGMVVHGFPVVPKVIPKGDEAAEEHRQIFTTANKPSSCSILAPPST